ncbi:MAG: DNA-processing protein DprA [Alicyclobacillus sp.]|nr:DNA-processing protein DprA [Alicyclobacillus sp.]
MSLHDDDQIRAYFASQIMLANEAAGYLGISIQRLHQLIRSGKLTPIKHSRAGVVFWRKDIEKRKEELSRDVAKREEVKSVKYISDAKTIQEAINYFTILSLHGWGAVKQTQSLIQRITGYIDFTEPLNQKVDELALLTGFNTQEIKKNYDKVRRAFEQMPDDVVVTKIGQEEYPPLLAITKEAPWFLFMRGNIRLAHLHTVSVVGTRNPTPEGENKARALAALLGKYRIVVASGLAKGIDRAAHEGALQNNTPTIAVLGTPLNKVYPKEHARLQQEIAERGLLISQFAPSSPVQRWNFPMRNAVMSGISLATVIVEAGETSGALIQADYALKQQRFVFVPKSAVDNPNLEWPRKYVETKGAHCFSRIDELIRQLEKSEVIRSDRGERADSVKTEVSGNVYRYQSTPWSDRETR